LDDLCDEISENARMDAAMMSTDQIQQTIADLNADIARAEQETGRVENYPAWIYAYCRREGLRSVLGY
jgi:uncharacterized small protein (DUF1192 family)